MTAGKNRRRNYLIDRRFQARFVLRFCALAVAGALITGIVLYLLSKDTVTTAFVNSRLSIVSTADYILPLIIGASLASVVVVGIATAIVVVFLSHRIAGPLFNIERSLKNIGEGDLSSEVTLRSDDQIRQLADITNQMRNDLKEKVLALKNEADKLGEGKGKESIKKVLDQFSV